MTSRWLFSTVGRRGYAAEYFKAIDPSVYILGTGNSPEAPAFRECDDARIVPSIADPTYQEHILELVERERIENILTFSDLDVVVLAEIRDELSALGANCFFPGEKLARLAQDKLATAQWSANNGMPSAKASMDLADFDEDTPLIVKPRRGSSSVGLAFPSDHEHAASAAVGIDEAMFQERVFGTEVNLEICGDLDGRPVRCSAWRKHHSRGGETDLSRTVRTDELVELAWKLGSALELIGPNDIDLMVNDDGFYLIEVNTRFGGGYPVSELAGAGFPAALLAMSQGKTVEQEATYRDGIWMLKANKPFGGTEAEMQQLLGVSLEAHFGTEKAWSTPND